MSVNGLDAPATVEAYQQVLADPGRWLLLNYISRDELGVWKCGGGGWAELRSALDEFAESSPLFGFFVYRRRKILLKYIPEGTSKLLQVRTAVHFSAITDHFSPHETVFSATAPGDLTDSALAAACSLHTDAPLGSSDGSTRRRALDEITEDVEEVQSSNPQVASILRRLKADKASAAQEQDDGPQLLQETPAGGPDDAASGIYAPTLPRPAPNQFARFPIHDAEGSIRSKSPLMEPSGRHELLETLTTLSVRREMREARMRERPAAANMARAESPHLYPRKPRGSRKNLENLRSEFHESRTDVVVHESRPGTSDSKYSFLSWKPKKKLFPRPAEGESLNRPATETSSRQKMPAGMRIALNKGESVPKPSKPDKPPKTPKAKQNLDPANESATMAGALTEMPNADSATNEITSNRIPEKQPVTYDQMSQMQPVPAAQPPLDEQINSPVGYAAALAPKSSESSMKKKDVGPEKQRLMKALQQRNQNLTRGPNSSATNGLTANGGQKVVDEDATKADSGVDFEGTDGQDKAVVSRGLSNGALPNGLGIQGPSSGKSPAHLDPSAVILDSRTVSDESKKRRALLGSLNTSPALGYDSEGLVDDESLMDELQNATVQEARRISLPATESPLSPVYSHVDKKPSVTSVTYQSSTVHGTSEANGERASETIRAGSVTSAERNSPVKRINVSAGISRRIQTLARDGGSQSDLRRLDMPSSSQGARAVPAASASRASPSLERPSFSRNSTNQSPPTTAATSDSNQYPTNIDMSSQAVSITARIVHAGGHNSPERLPSRAGQPATRDLQQSQVTIEQAPSQHGRAPSKTSFHRIERPPSVGSRPDSRESSFSSRTKQSLDHGLNFFGLRKSNEQKPAPRSRRSPSIGTLETVEEDGEEKRKPKMSNLFKRMSGFGSRKQPTTSASPPPPVASREVGGKTAHRPTTAQRINSAWIVGDLNVQFPDTLLWKRRWVEVDPSGFLCLSSTNASERMRTTPRRYHLSETKAPVVATPDGQELPYSKDDATNEAPTYLLICQLGLLVDLIDGGTLQLACEDQTTQGQVLRRLSDAYRVWTPRGT